MLQVCWSPRFVEAQTETVVSMKQANVFASIIPFSEPSTTVVSRIDQVKRESESRVSVLLTSIIVESRSLQAVSGAKARS